MDVKLAMLMVEEDWRMIQVARLKARTTSRPPRLFLNFDIPSALVELVCHGAVRFFLFLSFFPLSFVVVVALLIP